jgi:hypothetical protein
VDPHDDYTGTTWASWEACVRRFEEAWQRGEQPDVADYLPGDAGRCWSSWSTWTWSSA